MNRRQLFLHALRGALGDPYIWGGQAPGGYDCSGCVLYCLNQAGMNLPDMSADGLFHHFENHKIQKSDAQPGDLFFFWNKDQEIMAHVMTVYKQWPCGYRVLAGARGGSETTKTDRAAAELGAMIGLVPETYMGMRFAFAVDPFVE